MFCIFFCNFWTDRQTEPDKICGLLLQDRIYRFSTSLIIQDIAKAQKNNGALGTLANPLQRLQNYTILKIPKGCQGAQNSWQGLKRGFWVLPSTFAKEAFVQRLQSKPWTYKSKVCLSVFHSISNFQGFWLANTLVSGIPLIQNLEPGNSRYQIF